MIKLIGIELRYKLSDQVKYWKSIFDTIYVWQPTLVPTHYDILSHPEMDEPEAYNFEVYEDLIMSLLSKERLSWILSVLDQPQDGISVSKKKKEISFSIGLSLSTDDEISLFKRLIENLEMENVEPDLAMMFDRESKDAEAIFQGLNNFELIPPVLYLGPLVIERIGPETQLDSVPCVQKYQLKKGVLLQMRDSLWRKSKPQERILEKELKELLGFEKEKSISFLS